VIKKRTGIAALAATMSLIAACQANNQPPPTTSAPPPSSSPTNPYATLAPRVAHPLDAAAFVADPARV